MARGTDNLLIGRFYGSDSVGSILESERSAYPAFAAVSIAGERSIPAGTFAAFNPSRLVIGPRFCAYMKQSPWRGSLLQACSFALARPITLVLLGPKWIHAAGILGGFTVAALCLPLSNAAAWLFTSQGRGRDMFVTQVINARSHGSLVSCRFAIWSGQALPLLFPSRIYAFGYRSTTIASAAPGPVRTADLWIIFFRHLPVWAIVFFTTWGMLIMTSKFHPLFSTHDLRAGWVAVRSGRHWQFEVAPKSSGASA